MNASFNAWPSFLRRTCPYHLTPFASAKPLMFFKYLDSQCDLGKKYQKFMFVKFSYLSQVEVTSRSNT